MSKCAIIGGGPAGLNAALYLKRAGLDVFVIEKDVPGGEMLKTDKIENYLGFENISGGDLAYNMAKQVKDIGAWIIKDRVIRVFKEDNKDGKFILEMVNDRLEVDYVVVATGREPRKLDVRGSDDLTGRCLSYCAVCDGYFYKGLEVAVIGGGDAALTEALYLSDLCSKVYVLVRKDVRASEILKKRVTSKDNIVILKNTEVRSFDYDDDELKGVTLSNGEFLNVSGIFVAIGGAPSLDFLSDMDVNLKDGYIVTDERMRTNIPGLYAVGDVRYKDFYQIITAASDGAIAALSIKEDVR